MPFGNITIDTRTFEQRQAGIYRLSTVLFGQPTNEFRVRPGTMSKDNVIRAAVSRVLEKDITEGSSTVRRAATATLSLVTPASGFTPAEMDAMASDIASFITEAVVSRILQGDS